MTDETAHVIPTATRLGALAELVSILRAPDADFGHWELPPPKDGVHSLGWFERGPAANAFIAAVGRGGWIRTGFDWGTWLKTDEGRRFHGHPEAVETASIQQLERLITAIVRSDRFVEGSLAGAFESGLLARIAARAARLLEESAAGGGATQG